MPRATGHGAWARHVPRRRTHGWTRRPARKPPPDSRGLDDPAWEPCEPPTGATNDGLFEMEDLDFEKQMREQMVIILHDEKDPSRDHTARREDNNGKQQSTWWFQ